MYQEYFPWDVILYHEHFGNNVCNILWYISILDHTFPWQTEAINISTALFPAVSASGVHRGPESLLKTLQWWWWLLDCVDERLSPKTQGEQGNASHVISEKGASWPGCSQGHWGECWDGCNQCETPWEGSTNQPVPKSLCRPKGLFPMGL